MDRNKSVELSLVSQNSKNDWLWN